MEQQCYQLTSAGAEQKRQRQPAKPPTYAEATTQTETKSTTKQGWTQTRPTPSWAVGTQAKPKTTMASSQTLGSTPSQQSTPQQRYRRWSPIRTRLHTANQTEESRGVAGRPSVPPPPPPPPPPPAPQPRRLRERAWWGERDANFNDQPEDNHHTFTQEHQG